MRVKKYYDTVYSVRIREEWKPLITNMLEDTKEKLSQLTPKEFKEFQINHYNERLTEERNKEDINKDAVRFLKSTLKSLKQG